MDLCYIYRAWIASWITPFYRAVFWRSRTAFKLDYVVFRALRPARHGLFVVYRASDMHGMYFHIVPFVYSSWITDTTSWSTSTPSSVYYAGYNYSSFRLPLGKELRWWHPPAADAHLFNMPFFPTERLRTVSLLRSVR